MTAANDNRPKWYDDGIAARLPFMRKMANKMVGPDKADDLVNDAYVLAIRKWDNYSDEYKLGTWLLLHLKHALRDSRQKAGRIKRTAHVVSMDDIQPSCLPNQEYHMELRQTLAAIPDDRSGRMLLRYAMGDELKEMGEETGVSRERARQIKDRGLQKLLVALTPIRAAA